MKYLKMSSPLTIYMRLMLDLHEAISEGKCDEPEADAIRDKMDLPFYDLTEDEVKGTNKLSALLNEERDRLEV